MDPSTAALASAAAAASALVAFGNVVGAFPIARLGQNQDGGRFTRVWGFDNSRGEFSLTATLAITASLLWLGVALVPFRLVATAVVGWVVWVVFGRPVSHPGGPREASDRIQRLARWENKEWVATAAGKCLVAEDSHAHTEQAVNNGQRLTGSPSGRQIWAESREAAEGGDETFRFNPHENPNSSDKPFRAQCIREWQRAGKPLPASSRPATALEAARKGIQYFQMLQQADGHWAGDYGGPMFLLPGLVVMWYITGKADTVLAPWQREAMVRYLRCHQQADGGWGTHIESPSTMFGSVLSYVALRLLGVEASDTAARKAREFIRANGGAAYTASWAKFYLCLLGVMEWEGHNSIPPELFMLPNWFPFHPGRLWCHCRMVYLPMSYLYGTRFTFPNAERDPTVLALRAELYPTKYSEIDWAATRKLVAPMDNYSPIPWTMELAQDALVVWERWGGAVRRWVRRRGLSFVIAYIHAEDAQTNYVDIGPVNKVLNMLSVFHDKGARSDEFQRHALRVPDYLWVAEDGMKMQGYNGSQCWDSSFFAQAVSDTNLSHEFPDMTARVFGYLVDTQILSTAPARQSVALTYETPAMRQQFYRHVSEGGWPFSTSAHGWPISDCTAEGLKAVLAMRGLQCCKPRAAEMTDQRLFNACNVLLTLQNPDGGWATYENNRGYGWFEQLNPSEVFGDIMIDYSYVECSTASLSALVAFQKHFPNHRADEVARSIDRGRDFLKSIQRTDGSWYGSWACCFTYATWFGVEGLVLAGEPLHSPAIQSAVRFLLSHQNANGGWGEDFRSCYDKAYAPSGMERYGVGGSGVVPTAWALLALMQAQCQDKDAVARGIRFLMDQQCDDGDWPQQGILGVFNRACGITYTNYRSIFPVWALGRYATQYSRGLATGQALSSNALGSRMPDPAAQKQQQHSHNRQQQQKQVGEGEEEGAVQEKALTPGGPTKELVPAILLTGAVLALGFATRPDRPWPSPVGLLLGLGSVLVGQVVMLALYAARRRGLLPWKLVPIQPGAPLGPGSLSGDIARHLANPGGFLLLGSYLTITWMFELMPPSYYSLSGRVNLSHVLLQLLIVDFFQWAMHVVEHKASPWFYRLSHKPHHGLTNPKLTDAFDGSLGDTIVMILIPLFITANLVHCNAWSYMAFGTIFAAALCVVHSEWHNPWDPVFRALGVGTAADHHVHHKLFVYNYGHLFMFWDRAAGTYRCPTTVKTFSQYPEEA